MSLLNNFDLNGEQQEILQVADRFAQEQLYDLQERMDVEEWFPEDAFVKIAQSGFMGITVPEKWKGGGMDLFTSGLVLQAFGRWNPALALSWFAHENLCLNNIYRNANDPQRDKYLPGLCDGTKIGALGLTEPGAGSDALGSMRTTAERDGGDYVLNGRKMYITNGPVADVFLIYAKTDLAKGAGGISAFIVEKDYPGFTVAQKLIKMGFRGSPTGELVFDNCRVPAENLVGEENKGVSVVMSGLDIERALLAPVALGMAERAFDLALNYAQVREQFDQPISNFQMIQAKLADMYTAIATMRSYTYQVVAACNDLEIGGGGRGDIHKETAAAALYSASACMKVLDEAVQIHGGIGYIWESEINRLYRAGKLLEIGAGTQEVRRMIISQELLKKGTYLRTVN